MLKKSVSIILTFVMVFGLLHLSLLNAGAGSVLKEGYLYNGKSVYYVIGSDGTLDISGNGVIFDSHDYLTDGNTAPWYPYRNMIKTVIIHEGITKIGIAAFERCGMTTISIPSTVNEIEASAFYYCTNLESVIIPEGVTVLNYGVFSDCKSLKSITLPGSIQTIFSGCASRCENLTDVYYAGSELQWNNIKNYGLDFWNVTIHYEIETTYYFNSTVSPANTAKINEETTFSVSPTKGKLDGEYFPNSKITWSSDNPEILKIKDYDHLNSVVTVKGLKYGFSTLRFYVDGVERTSQSIAVLMDADEMISQYSDYIIDNASTTVLENALTVPKNILSHYSIGDITKVCFFTMISEGLGTKTVVKEGLAAGGIGNDRRREALDSVTLDMLSDYFNVDEYLFQSNIKGFSNSWSIIKTAASTADKISQSDSEDAADESMKSAIAATASISESDAAKVIKSIKGVTEKLDDALDLYKIIGTAVIMAQYDKDTVCALMNAVPKSSYAYQGLKDVYDDMSKNFAEYIIETFATEKVVSEISSAITKGLFSQSKTLKVLNTLGSIISTVYKVSGGVTIDSFNKCLYSHRVASDLLKSLKYQRDSKSLQAVFELCVSATKIALEKSISICENEVYFNTKKLEAERYLEKIKALDYDTFLAECQKELFNASTWRAVPVMDSTGSYTNTIYFYYKLPLASTGNSEESENTNIVDAFENTLAIPSNINGVPSASIGEEGFKDLSDFEAIILPDSVKIIGKNAFENCTATEIIIGSNVETIDDYAFCNCRTITDILLPDSLREIGNSAFENCDSLTSLTIGTSVMNVGERAFSNCTALESIYFANPETDISDNALIGCNENLVVYGYAGSDAEMVAGENGYRFVNLGEYIKSLSIETPADKTVFEFGDEIDLDGLTLKAEKIDGTYEIIDENFTVSYDASVSGKQSLTVGYLNKTVEYEIEITEAKAQRIEVSDTELQMSPGQSATLGVTVVPENSENREYRLISSDEDIVFVHNDTVYANAVGEASVTVSTMDNSISTTVSITVTNNWKVELSGPDDYDSHFIRITNPGCYRLMISGSEDAVVEVLNETGAFVSSINYNNNEVYSFKSEETYIIRSKTTSINNDSFEISMQRDYDAEELEQYQSSHPCYGSDDTRWIITKDGVSGIRITFSDDSYLDPKTSYLRILGEDNYTVLYSLTGEELAGNTFEVIGDTIILDLIMHGESDAYGFSLKKLETFYFIESEHPYPDDCDESQSIFREGAKRLALTFSEDTETEDGYDYIYLYDKDDNEIGKYSGTELAGKTVFVPGDTAVIRLTSDESSNYYGYYIEKVTPYYEDCLHANTDIFDMEDPTCVDKGYSGDLKCLDCGELLQKGHVLPATGEHTFEDGFCTVCGKIDSDAAESLRLNSSVNFTLGFFENDKKVYRFIPDTDLVAQLDVDNSVILITLYDSDINEIEMGYLYGNNGMRLKHHFKANKPYYFLLERNYDCGESSDFKAKATLTKLPDNLMQIGETNILKADKDDTQLYFTFVPDEDTAVIIHTDSSKVVYGYLWDYDENWMGNGDNIENGCDIISYVKAGRRYLGFLSLDEDCSGESAEVSLNTYEIDQLIVGQTLTVHHNANDLYDYVMFTPKNDGYYRISPVGRVYNSDMMPVGTGNFFKGKAGEKYITVLRTTADTISFSYDVTAEQFQPDTIAVGQCLDMKVLSESEYKYLLFHSTKNMRITCKVSGLDEGHIELFDENMQYMEPDESYDAEPTRTFNAEAGKDYIICVYSPEEGSKYQVQLINEDNDGSYLLGDADGNGEIEVTDATFIQRFVADIPTPYSNEQLMCGDVDDSGDLTIMDVTAIQFYLCHLKIPYKIGDPVS